MIWSKVRFSLFLFLHFLSFFSFFLLLFDEIDSSSPIISVFTWSSENSLVRAPCKDLPMELSFCFGFFTFDSIDNFPRSRLSTAPPCSPKLAKRSGQFLAIKSWISSSLIPPAPLLSCSFLLSSPLLFQACCLCRGVYVNLANELAGLVL